MPTLDPSHPLAKLLDEDRRYSLDAYLFVLEALTFAQETLGFGHEPPTEELDPPRKEESAATGRTRSRSRRERRRAERHVSGQQLCEAARQFGQQQYGFLAKTVLATWGIRKTADIGEIVFNMIDSGQMRKTRNDKREDFHNVFDFHDAFARDLAFVVPDRV